MQEWISDAVTIVGVPLSVSVSALIDPGEELIGRMRELQ
jgi:hypothetical protein